MSYPGGLLIHTAHALRFCKNAIKQARELGVHFSSSVIIAGCILRNIGWHTTTIQKDGIIRPRDAFFMTGLYRASFRYIHQLMIAASGDLEINVPESLIQALENMCNATKDIKTFEGRVVACADNMADTIELGGVTKGNKHDNWHKGIFLGHLNT